MSYIKISFRKEEGTVHGNVEDALGKIFGMTMPPRLRWVRRPGDPRWTSMRRKMRSS